MGSNPSYDQNMFNTLSIYCEVSLRRHSAYSGDEV